MVLKSILYFTACILFLFFYWKRLREDYISSQIFTSGFYILFGIIIGKLISFRFAPDLWFWFSFIGFFLSIWIGILRFKLRIFETFEAAIYAGLTGYLVIQVDLLINQKTLSILIWVIITLCLITLFLFLDKRYKRFTWYKSGKVGFSGMSVAGAFFLIRSLVALFDNDMLSLGGYEAILSGIVAFTSFLAVYNLAKQTQ